MNGQVLPVECMIDNITHYNEDKQISNEILFNILSHKRRQYALYCLDRYQTPMTIAELADEVARLEYDAQTLAQIPKEAVKQIYTDLYHSHIPMMKEANLLEDPQDQDAVCLKYDLSDLPLSELIGG